MAKSPSQNSTPVQPASNQPNGRSGAGWIGGQYRPDIARPRADSGAGHKAYDVLDQRGARPELMAIAIDRGGAPRAALVAALTAEPVPGMLNPLVMGGYQVSGQAPASFVISAAPPGPSLLTHMERAVGRGADARGRGAINDLELIETVMRPVAHALDALVQRCFTHRAIRPDNLFAAARGQPAMLGAAWGSPPGVLQPALYEPPYFAECHRFGRGDGVIADDVYALGVTLLVLAVGETTFKAFDDELMVQRKLRLGSYAALVEEARLPPALSDLLRGMLAEEPEHRPPPVLLTDPSAARARRVAARPPRRAQRPIDIGGIEAWNARALAHAMARYPEAGMHATKSGDVDRWLRRMLGDSALAHRLDVVLSSYSHEGADGAHADVLRLARTTATLDPLAPLHWRGLSFWPDAMGAVLAAGFSQPEITGRIEEIVETEAVLAWAEARPERCDTHSLRPESRQLRVAFQSGGLAGQLPRVLYALNPNLPCQSKLVEGALVTRVSELLAALEQVAVPPERRQGVPADRHVVGYIAARGDHRLDAELAAFANCPAHELPLALLRLFASVQVATDTSALPNLAQWLAALCADRVEQWHGQHSRDRLAARLRARAETGVLHGMLVLLEDRAGRADDRQGAERAASQVQWIDQELDRLAAGGDERLAHARAAAHDVVGALALAGVALAVVLLAFS
jgi:hypothetical protein